MSYMCVGEEVLVQPDQLCTWVVPFWNVRAETSAFVLWVLYYTSLQTTLALYRGSHRMKKVGWVEVVSPSQTTQPQALSLGKGLQLEHWEPLHTPFSWRLTRQTNTLKVLRGHLHERVPFTHQRFPNWLSFRSLSWGACVGRGQALAVTPGTGWLRGLQKP